MEPEVVLGGSPGSRRLSNTFVEVVDIGDGTSSESKRPASAPPDGAPASGAPSATTTAIDEDTRVPTPPSNQPDEDADGILTFRTLGWRRPHLMDEIAARWAVMEDWPLEESSRDDNSKVTEQELASIPALRKSILQRLGVQEPPTGFQAHHFTRWKLLCMLRARGGDISKSTDRAIECLHAVDLALEAARRFEASEEAMKDLRDAYIPFGFYGRDRRGAPVLYYRLGKMDVTGYAREVGIDFHHDGEWYTYLVQWDGMIQQNARQRTALQGHLIVVDLSGFSLMNVISSKGVAKHVLDKPTYPAGEHPMPEGARKILICGAPWWVGKLWAIAKRLLPARTTAKMSIFSDSQWADFRKALFARVETDQVPAWAGGTGATPWPYGEGGEVPKGVGAAAKGSAEPPGVGRNKTI